MLGEDEAATSDQQSSTTQGNQSSHAIVEKCFTDLLHFLRWVQVVKTPPPGCGLAHMHSCTTTRALLNQLKDQQDTFATNIRSGCTHILSGGYTSTVSAALNELRGTALPGFLGQPAFVHLVRTELSLWDHHSRNLVKATEGEIQDVLCSAANSSFGWWPDVHEQVQKLVCSEVANMRQCAEDRLSELVSEFHDILTWSQSFDLVLASANSVMSPRTEGTSVRQDAENANTFFTPQEQGLLRQLSITRLHLPPARGHGVVEMQVSVFCFVVVACEKFTQAITSMVRSQFLCKLHARLAEVLPPILSNENLFNLLARLESGDSQVLEGWSTRNDSGHGVQVSNPELPPIPHPTQLHSRTPQLAAAAQLAEWASALTAAQLTELDTLGPRNRNLEPVLKTSQQDAQSGVPVRPSPWGSKRSKIQHNENDMNASTSPDDHSSKNGPPPLPTRAEASRSSSAPSSGPNNLDLPTQTKRPNLLARLVRTLAGTSDESHA